MKARKKWLAATGILCLLMLAAQPALAGRRHPAQPQEPAPSESTRGKGANKVLAQDSYANLAQLVLLIGNDAARHFQSFYGKTLVKVEPFTLLTGSKNQGLTTLGAALTDQMAAELANLDFRRGYLCGEEQQRLKGVLAEINGHLRVHISGVNRWGEQRSYVVMVEMSEPIYRGLHSSL